MGSVWVVEYSYDGKEWEIVVPYVAKWEADKATMSRYGKKFRVREYVPKEQSDDHT